MKVVHLNKSEFLTKVVDYENNPKEWKYLGDKPAVLDFYAEWCGPCRALSPLLDEIAAEYGDSLYVYKVNVDKEEELSDAFGIRTIPTVYFIPMEGTPRVISGALSKTALVDTINSTIFDK